MYVLHLDLGAELRGGQRQVLYLARRLAASADQTGVTTGVACPAQSPLAQAARDAGVEVCELPSRRAWSPATLLAVLRHARARHTAILHTHDAHAALLGALLKPLLPGVALAHTRRVSYPLGRGLSRWKYRIAELNVAVSREIAAVMIAAGVPKASLTVIPSGIDPTRYTQRPPNGANPDLLTIGAIGALTTQKGYHVLLEALGQLARSRRFAAGKAWRAVIVGDGDLRPTLVAQAQRLGVAERVQFLGYIDSREILPQMDILVAPSIDGEGSSGVAREAWTVGIPLVVSELASNLELVKHEVNGLTFRSGDAEALAAALTRLVDAPELTAALVAQGRLRVREYTVEAMSAAYLARYRELGRGQG